MRHARYGCSMSKLEPVGAAYDLPEALCLKSFLESQGIPTFINGLHHAQVDWWMIVALSGLEVRVPSDHADEVRDYMTAFRAEPSHCQSASGCFWEKPIRSFVQLMIVSLMTGVPPLWARKRKWGAVGNPNTWCKYWRTRTIILFAAGIAVLGVIGREGMLF